MSSLCTTRHWTVISLSIFESLLWCITIPTAKCQPSSSTSQSKEHVWNHQKRLWRWLAVLVMSFHVPYELICEDNLSKVVLFITCHSPILPNTLPAYSVDRSLKLSSTSTQSFVIRDNCYPYIFTKPRRVLDGLFQALGTWNIGELIISFRCPLIMTPNVHMYPSF